MVTEKIMDLKEQPGNTVSAGQEDFPSVLLETAASLPSLAPLSAAAFKEHEYLGNLPAVLPTEGTLREISDEASKEFSEKAKKPFVDRDLPEFSELEYSEMGSIVQTSVPKTDVCPTASVLPKMQPSGIQSDVSLGDKHRAYAELGG